MEQKAAGISYVPTFIAEAARAYKGRIQNAGSAQLVNPTSARDFFEKRSAMDSETGRRDIVESQSIPYKKLLTTSAVSKMVTSLTSKAVILDFGCGHAKLHHSLRAMGFVGMYIGYDIDRVAIARLQAMSWNGLHRFATAIDADVRFDIAFACNTFVYCPDEVMLASLKKLREHSSKGATLIIMEPCPKWYWEFRFDGMQLCPRSHKRIYELGKEAGWLVRMCANVSLSVIGRHHLFPIANCMSATCSY